MLLHAGIITLIRCSSDEGIRSQATIAEDEQHNNPIYLPVGGAHSLEHNINDQIIAGTAAEYFDIYKRNYTNIFQQQLNAFALLNSQTASPENMYMCYNFFLMKYNELYSNFVNQICGDLSMHSDYQQSNEMLSINLGADQEEDQKSNSDETDSTYILNHTQNSEVSNNRSTYESHDMLCTEEKVITDNENSNPEVFEDRNNLQELNNMNAIGNVDADDEMIEEETLDQTGNNSFEFSDDTSQKLNSAIIYLNLLKTYEKRFLKLEMHYKRFHTILSEDLKELSSVTEQTQKLCKTWIEMKESILNTENNRIIQSNLLSLAKKVKTAIQYFKRFIMQKTFSSSDEIFDRNNETIKGKIKNIEKCLKHLMSSEINTIPVSNNHEKIPIKYESKKSIKFLYRSKNDNLIQVHEINLQKKLRPAFLSAFEKQIYLCIYRTDQYLKILKVDLETQQHQEISEYIIDEGEEMKYPKLGFGSKYSILRTDSDGNIFLLKSAINATYVTRATLDYFELLVVDNKFKKLASIEIESVSLNGRPFRPAVVDFVVHDGLLYVLDVKYKCVKTFDKFLNFKGMISIPERLIDEEDIHLAASSKYIYLSFGKTIYYAKNDTNEFKCCKFKKLVFNIVCYGEEHIVVRFTDCVSLIKLKESLFDIEITPLPFLDQLKKEKFATFIIEDNVLYSLCAIGRKVLKLDFILNQNDA